MTLWPRRALLSAMVLSAAMGSVLGTRALQQAVIRARDLYRVDTAGSQMESDLEYETQDSRRAFLYALAVTDPNDQLPYVAEARRASGRVNEASNRLRGLGAAEITAGVDRFEQTWKQYDRARDQIISLILLGNSAQALRVEAKQGQPAFAAALASLHALKAALEVRARNDSLAVNATLHRSIVGLTAFLISTLTIVSLLIRANQSRRRGLESLHAAHKALGEAREMERERASILHMVSTHAALSHTLDAVAALAPRGDPQSGAAIWIESAGELRLQVKANLSRELASAFQLHVPPPEAEPSSAAQFEQFTGRLAAPLDYQASHAAELKDAAGERIGMVQMFAPLGRDMAWEAILDQMAQLASVAIENSLLYERLAFQAQHDTLTKLPNRLLFQDRVQQATRLAQRHNKKVAVIWVDLDKYKQINDTLGHRVGDEVLCEAARRMESCLRQSDSVARVGGDEFTLLLRDLTCAEDAEPVAAKILAAFQRPLQLGSHEIMLSISLGVSIFPEHGEDPMTLLRNADLAMYSAKRAGGGTFRIFQVKLSETMHRRVLIERELKTALEHNELSLEYQPLLDRNGRLDSVEALLRWNNPRAGHVSPVEFIPVAEETGLILSIGEWVTRNACRDGARWIKQGFDMPRIAVNVSALQFADTGFIAMVECALADYGLPASRLELEITETALMNNLDAVIEQIEALRRLGVRFAIDDFGTGYSSLSHLRNLPVDCVKIDRSFIKDLQEDEGGCATLVRGIIALAHDLRLQVVAEGVETAEQLVLLRTLGCDVNQGFYLHRPMPVGALEELLEANRRQYQMSESASEDETSGLLPMHVPA